MKTRLRLAMPMPTAGNPAPSYETLAARRRDDASHLHAQDGDALRTARGVFFAALLGCGLWLAILYCAWLIVR